MEARFVDVVPNVRVVQAVDFVSDDPAFAGTMTMTWELSAENAGTQWRSELSTSRLVSLPRTTLSGRLPLWAIWLLSSGLESARKVHSHQRKAVCVKHWVGATSVVCPCIAVNRAVPGSV